MCNEVFKVEYNSNIFLYFCHQRQLYDYLPLHPKKKIGTHSN